MKVYVDPRLGSVHDLITFSDKLVSVKEHFLNNGDYRPHAKLPVDFRELDEHEVLRFTSPLEELSLDDELGFVAIFPCDPQSEQRLDFKPFFSLSTISVLNVSVDYAKSPSITLDRTTGHRLGLHLDNWDEHELHSRWKSRNRIVVNRGPADRYVYLVLVPVEEMARSLEDQENLHPCEVADLYIGQPESRIPCLRIRQRPNVAYVVCTERLVHDACVCSEHHKAESRHYLGHFVKA